MVLSEVSKQKHLMRNHSRKHFHSQHSCSVLPRVLDTAHTIYNP